MIEGLYKPFQHWGEHGGVWVISDLHFGEDDDLHKAYPHRPSPMGIIIMDLFVLMGI